MHVLVVKRKLPGIDSEVSLVESLDTWVDPFDCESWVEDRVERHKEEICRSIPEFKRATFSGSVHRVIGSL